MPLFTGNYKSFESEIWTDFLPFLDSFVFVLGFLFHSFLNSIVCWRTPKQYYKNRWEMHTRKKGQPNSAINVTNQNGTNNKLFVRRTGGRKIFWRKTKKQMEKQKQWKSERMINQSINIGGVSSILFHLAIVYLCDLLRIERTKEKTLSHSKEDIEHHFSCSMTNCKSSTDTHSIHFSLNFRLIG